MESKGSSRVDRVHDTMKSGAFWKMRGSSMYPNFIPDDIIWMAKVPLNHIRFWDVVFFEQINRSEIAMHRVWWKRKLRDGNYELWTKGDFNWKWDLPVHSDRVLGIGIAVYKMTDWRFLDKSLWRAIQGLKGFAFLFIYTCLELASGKPGVFWRVMRLFLLQVLCYSQVWNRSTPMMPLPDWGTPIGPNTRRKLLINLL